MQFLSAHVLSAAERRASPCVPVPSLTADTETHQELFARLTPVLHRFPQLGRLGPPTYALDPAFYLGRDLEELIREIPDALRQVADSEPLSALLRGLGEVCGLAQSLDSGVFCTGD